MPARAGSCRCPAGWATSFEYKRPRWRDFSCKTRKSYGALTQATRCGPVQGVGGRERPKRERSAWTTRKFGIDTDAALAKRSFVWTGFSPGGMWATRDFAAAGHGANHIQVRFREACGARTSGLTCRHDENLTDRVRR
jgi:hypothetical protein